MNVAGAYLGGLGANLELLGATTDRLRFLSGFDFPSAEPKAGAELQGRS